MLRSRILRTVVLAAMLVAGAESRVVSQTPQGAKFSTYAPAADLVEQVDYYIKDIEAQLVDYDLAKQSRVWKHANTLAVIALVLANHDEQHPLKPAMPTMLGGAKALVASEENLEAAKAALATIKTAREGKATGGEAKWEKVASTPALMKQVPLVHAGLRRGVTPNRLARLAKESAAQAATLAAIAEASMLDRQYGDTPEKAAQWAAFCGEMRDASGEVNTAVHAMDQARVDAGMKRLLASCDACHAKFQQK
jgi:hypothetical protein